MLCGPRRPARVERLFYPLEPVDKGATRRFIEATVAAALALPVEELGAKTRRQAPVAFARQVSMYCAHVVLGMSLTEAGALFDRDRTTAAHACRVVEDRRDEPDIDHIIAEIEGVIRSWAQVVAGCRSYRVKDIVGSELASVREPTGETADTGSFGSLRFPLAG